MTKQILVTNDDGVLAPGLLALAQEMRNVGEVTILAPDRNWSGGGHVKTLDRALRVREFRLEDGSQAFASDGAPSDCVSLAVLGYFKEKFDLVVSGINVGANLGHDVTYSGTVTAAMEAVIAGIPGVAVSLEIPEGTIQPVDYSASTYAARVAVENVLAHGLPEDTLLNVNIPFLKKKELKGFRVTRQGLRVYHSRLDERIDPRNRPYYWIGGLPPHGVADHGTDIWAIENKLISVTPLNLDITDHRLIEDLKRWKLEDIPL